MPDGGVDNRTVDAEVFARQMQDIGESLDMCFNGSLKGGNRTVGFVLLTFPYGTCGKCNYISNGANREDMVKLFREIIERWDRGGVGDA